MELVGRKSPEKLSRVRTEQRVEFHKRTKMMDRRIAAGENKVDEHNLLAVLTLFFGFLVWFFFYCRRFELTL